MSSVGRVPVSFNVQEGLKSYYRLSNDEKYIKSISFVIKPLDIQDILKFSLVNKKSNT